MKNKRLITGLLSICLAAASVAALSGCGAKEDKLVWYMIGDEPEAHDKVMAKANEIIKSAIGMEVDMQYIDASSFAEKMKLKMASGEEYDITWAGYANNYAAGVELGGFYDITDLIAETGLDEVIPEFYLQSATIKGRIYGIPNIQVVSNPNVMEVPQRIVDDCGLQPYMDEIDELSNINASYDDIAKAMDLYGEMFAIINEKHPELDVLNPSPALNMAWLPKYETMLSCVSVKKDGSDNNLVLDYETEEWKLGVKKLSEWYQKGYIRNDIASAEVNQDSKEERLKIGFVMGNWKPGNDVAVANKYGESMSNVFIFDPYVQKTSANATMLAVGANTKHPKEAVELIKLINSDKELYNIICWGIEGETYTKNEDGTVTVIEAGGYKDIGASAWKYGNNFNSFVPEGQPLDVHELTEKMNNEADKSPALGFTPDQTNLATEVANVASVIAEYKAKIYFGSGNPDEWYDEFCRKMEQAGSKKILEEIQKQYDEFLVAKN